MINQKIYKQLLRGLEQELWYLGQDTLKRESNLLEKYGFHRYRTSGHEGSSRYKLKWRNRTLDFHSLCIGIYGNGEKGGIMSPSRNNEGKGTVHTLVLYVRIKVFSGGRH